MGRTTHSIEFKHKVCKFYENHTVEHTSAEFGVHRSLICKWRKQLGYRNKFFNFNLATEGLQPVMQRREVLHFKSVRSQNGDMKLELLQKNQRIQELEDIVAKLQQDSQLMNTIRQLFN